MSAAFLPDIARLSEESRRSYHALLPSGVSLEEALKPDRWAHFQHWQGVENIGLTEVTLHGYDPRWTAKTLVMDAGRGFVKLQVLRFNDLQDIGEVEQQDSVQVKYGNIHTRYQLIRSSDNCILKSGIVDKGDALREAASYAKRAA